VKNVVIHRFGLLGVAAALALSVGCGRHASHVPLIPAASKLSYHGKPLAGALVVLVPLHPAAGTAALRPSALTGADGTFRLSTYAAADGAPAGEYAVTVVYRVPPSGGTADAHTLALSTAPDSFGGRYADPKTSRLRLKIDAGLDLPALDLH
jgi:hypothetical protein